jgi:hypothetical protein
MSTNDTDLAVFQGGKNSRHVKAWNALNIDRPHRVMAIRPEKFWRK